MNAIENYSIQNAILPFTFINICQFKAKTHANGSQVDPCKKAKPDGILKNAIKMHSEETSKNKRKQPVHKKNVDMPCRQKPSLLQA
jgi:hypothetical protein